MTINNIDNIIANAINNNTRNIFVKIIWKKQH